MGLSRLPKDNKGDITTFQLLLELVRGISTLIEDPKALQKAINDAYSLSEEEESKANAARADIAKNDALLSDQRKQQAALDAAISELEDKKASIQSSLDAIKKEQNRLAKADELLGKREIDLNNKENDLSDREARLAFGNQQLQIDREALNARISALAEDEKALKDKAAQLRSIVGA